MNTLHDLWVKELQDLYSAENQITEALPYMIEAAASKKLAKGFEDHLAQTENQIKRLEQIATEMDIDLEGKKCKGIQGLLEEGEEIMSEDAQEDVKDAALIGAAQKVEHYEIAGYGTAVAYAKLMKHQKAAKLLQETLDEEGDTDKKLTKLAEESVNKDSLNE